MRTYLRAIGTANPRRYATQREFYDWLVAHLPMTPDEQNLYRRVALDGPIQGRHFGLDYDDQAADMAPDALIARFQKHGTLIATQAARNALEAAGLQPRDIGGLVVNTCTGYLCPGLTSYVAEQLEIEPGVKTFDLMGMGCGAAVPNLEAAAGILARQPDRPVVSIAVEICSATMYMGSDPDLIVSNSIFGDGAAAAILDAAERIDRPPLARIVDFETGLYPRHREELRYRTQQGRLRNVLSKRVPVIGAKVARETACRLLARHGLAPEKIDFWAVHPGGTVVLDQIGEKLGLIPEQLRFSYDVFRQYGNMSSPSVLFVLNKLLNEAKPQPGQKGLMLGFGAGFSAFAALLEF